MVTSQVNVAVIVLTVNQRQTTLRCLESLKAVQEPPSTLVLWDNGSTDGTAEAVRAMMPQALVHHHPSNLGVASGRNEAARLAIDQLAPTHLLFMDNDMTVTPEFLDRLAAPFIEDARLAQTTGKILDASNPRRIYGAGGCRLRFWLGDTSHVGHGELDEGQYDAAKQCIPSGGCMLVRTDIFTQMGGFDEFYSPYGPEDLDFGLRVAEANYYGLYVPEAIIFHESRPSRTFEGGHYTESYATNRSRYWFHFMGRHAPVSQRLGFYLVGAPYRMLSLAVRQARKGNLLPAVRGLVGGFLEARRW